MANSTPVLVRLSPDKLAFLDSEAQRLGVPRATVIQLWIAEKAVKAVKTLKIQPGGES